MKILFLVPYTPNLIRTRPYNLIRSLSKLGHSITLVTLYTDAAEQEDLAALEATGVFIISERLRRGRSLTNSLGALLSNDPVQAAYCWHPGLASRLEKLLTAQDHEEPFDIIHVEHLRGARYGLLARSATRSIRTDGALAQGQGPLASMPIIWDSVDCISHLFRQAMTHSSSRFGRVISRLELARTERYEAHLARTFDKVLCTSPADKAALLQLITEFGGSEVDTSHISVLPNGVDLDYFYPDPQIAREPDTLVVTGKMSYHANITMATYFVREVMPLVWAGLPHVKVNIAGKDPVSEVRNLAQVDARVIVTGSTPDLRPYLRQAALAVAPITYGAGIQNKVLEAMACGTPVVATSKAVSALTLVPGREVLIGDDAISLAEGIHRMMTEPELRQTIGKAGRAYVLANHDWVAIAQQLAGIYSTTIQARIGDMFPQNFN